MRIRDAAFVVIIVAVLAACTSSKPAKSTGSTASTVRPGPPSKQTGPLSPKCAQLVAAAQKINAAQTSLYAGSAGQRDQAIDALDVQLGALEQSVPGDITAVLADMVRQFHAARDALNQSGSASSQRIAQIAAQISSDNQRVASYVKATCPTL